MKRILFFGLCFLLSCSVALIGVNAADTINFVVSSSSLIGYNYNGSWYDSNYNSIHTKPVIGDKFELYWSVSGSWDVASNFDTSPFMYFTCEIDTGIYSASQEFDPSGDCYFSFGGGETSYSDTYLYGTNGNNVVVTWMIDIDPDATTKIDPPFEFVIPIVITKDGNWNGYSGDLSFSASASIPEGPSYEDLVTGGIADINDKLTQILVDIDSEELAALIEEKLRQSDVGTLPESPIDQGEIDELESVEDNLFNLADEKKQAFGDALNTWQSAFTSAGGGGKIGVVTGSIFNKILAIPFIRDLVYLSLGFGLITFTLRLGRKLV